MPGIVVGTDGTSGGRAAVLRAAQLARALHERVVVVSAYTATPVAAAMSPEVTVHAAAGREAADAALREARADLESAGVEYDLRAVQAGAADALVDVAELEQADTVVVGSRGMRGARRLLGSVPNAVSHRAPCSVLIVRTD